MFLWLSKTEYSPEKLMVILSKAFLFYARINYHFKASEMKNIKKLVE